jgi:hypothetical protein
LIAKAKASLHPVAVFAVNLFVCWRYFRAEYTNQIPSIEGVFIALEEYIQRHWPTYDWFSIWYGGVPFTRVYQPITSFCSALLFPGLFTQVPLLRACYALRKGSSPTLKRCRITPKRDYWSLS